MLPWIQQGKLFKEFHLDEPWDSDHNKKLLEKMPPLFGSGDETHYQVFAGKGTLFEGEKVVRINDTTSGGPSKNTILLVEAKKAAPWTKPEDVPFDAGKLVPQVGGLFEDVFYAAMADGSVRSFPRTIKEETLRALVTRDGGEVVDPNNLDPATTPQPYQPRPPNSSVRTPVG